MILRIAAGMALASAMAANAQTARAPELLILGLPHFGNPGRDIANSHVEDVRSPARQREIDAVVTALARFHPTRVAVEWPADKQGELDARYADFRAGRYRLTANEIDQIGLKLAARLGLPRVDAIDWNEEPPGKDADYDFVNWANAHGRGADWKAYEHQSQLSADARSRLMACTPISTWLRQNNTADHRRNDQLAYYRIADFGDRGANPGAAWVGAWYARNLRILDNIRYMARAGDRILAVYGAGHGFLLDQQARESGAFQVTDTLAYLPKSPRDSWTRCRS